MLDQAKPRRPSNPIRRFRNRLRRRIRQLFRSEGFQLRVGILLAHYLRFVNATSTMIREPADPYARLAGRMPYIITTWHGQHFMLPFGRAPGHDVRALISRHGDGGINAVVAERLGLGIIRGSGGRDRERTLEKGGVRGFLEMKSTLAAGISVSMIADISNGVARRAGSGIIALARISGRPIVPAAMTTSRRITLRSWDKATVNLPFSRTVLVVGEAVDVPADADPEVLEACRQRLEDELNRITERAYAIADRRG